MSNLYLHYFKRQGPWETRNYAIVLDTQSKRIAINRLGLNKRPWWISSKRWDYKCVPVVSGLTLRADGYDSADLMIDEPLT